MQRVRRILLASSILSFLLLPGCGNLYTYDLISKEDTILAVGDNFVAGYGVSDRFSFPSILSQLTGRSVVNAGRSGTNTGDLLALARPHMEDPSVKLIILIAGYNDYLRGLDSKFIRANYIEFFRNAQKSGIPVLFVTFSGSEHSGYAMWAETALSFSNVIIDDESLVNVIYNPIYIETKGQLNVNGYRVLAGNIERKLRKLGFIR